MMDAASAPPTPGSAHSLLAGFARLVLLGLVLVVPLILSRFLLLVAFVLAGLLVGLFWAVFVCAGLLAGFVLTTVFVVGGAFLLPVAGV